MIKHLKQIFIYIKSFYFWWLGELSSLIPDRVKGYFRDKGHENRFIIANEHIEIISKNEEVEEIRIFGGNISDIFKDEEFLGYLENTLTGLVSIQLSDDHILERTVELPEIAARDFKNIIKLEISNLLPMNINHICFDSYILNENSENGYIDIQLAMIKKSFAHNIIDCLERCSLGLKDIASDSYNFLNLERKYKQKNQKMIGGFVTGIITLSFICGIVLFNGFEQREVFLKQNIERLSGQAQEINRLKEEIEIYNKKEQLYYERLNKIRFDQILEALTVTFPENSWVFNYNQSSDKITIAGRTPDSSILIQGLDKNPLFTNVLIRSSNITNVQGVMTERFIIGMDIGGGNE